MKLSTKVNLIISLTITTIIIVIFYIIAQRYDRLIKDDLLLTARSFYKNIVITRAWIAQHEGVYVEKNLDVQSNPYLKNPDIKTTNNGTFTLKNPALVTRELSELSKKMGGKFQFHITSLNPINPGNSPNIFERQALNSFRDTTKNSLYLEYSRIEKINNKSYFRYFGPLFTEPSCMSCHSEQGYNVGDIRGGISVILPMDSIEQAKHQNYLFMILSALLTIIVLSFIINFLIRQIVIKPLQKIEDAALSFEQGNYFPLRINKNDEIGDLANAFQTMQKKIQLYTKDLQQSEKKYRTLLESSLEAVLIVNEKDKIIDANENIVKLSQHNIKEILNKSIHSLIDYKNPKKYNQTSKKQNMFETTITNKDGSMGHIEVYISPEYYETDQEANLRLFYLRDLSERKRIEKIMIETEKMYALNQLSSGIAHEIRNPLFSVRNNLNYLKENFPNISKFLTVFAEIDTGIKRINVLVNSILDYARPHQPEFKMYDIKKVINRSLDLIGKQFEKAYHTVSVNIPEDTPLIEIDPHKLEQVFINLGTNSLQAMKEKGEFEIRVQPLKRNLKITVSDNGQGINKDYLSKIFDPFFTRTSNGTGLGLSIVKNIIQQHNGEISIKSKPELGTKFKIILPLKQN